MSLSKKALMIGIGSTLAVGGVATAIAVPLSQRQSETKKPESKPWTSLTAAKNVDEALKNLSISSIQFQSNEANNVFKRNEHYAFNVDVSNISLKQENRNTFPSWVNFNFKIDPTKNKVADLNDGKLTLELEAKKDDTVLGTVTFNIKDFKTVSQEAKRLVKEQNKKITLDLSAVGVDSYRSIENLNELKAVVPAGTLRTGASATEAITTMPMESGLTTLLHELTVNGNEQGKPNPKEWSVETKVKLDRIVKGDQKPSFYLTSGESNKHLKLVTGTENNKQEILVDEVVVTNLLASNISIRPNGFNVETNAAFEKEFAEAKDSSYKRIGETNKVQLEVKQSSGNQVVSTININPYLIEKETKDQEIKASLLVSFGSNEQTKTYDFSVEKDLNELKEAEFGFNVYLKKFDNANEKVLKAMTLTTGSELNTYFAVKNFSMPVASTMLEMTSSPKGAFTKTELKSTMLMKDFVLGKAMKVNMQSHEGLDVNQQTLLSENWAAFAAYSYKGIAMGSVLLTPTIDVIHLEVKQPATVPGTDSGAK